VAHLESVPPAQQSRVFLEYWTLKEAYIKARGLGLHLSPRTFAFEIGAQEAVTFHAPADDSASAWQFRRWPLDADYMMAAAIRADPSGPIDVVLREVTVAGLTAS
jgi:4'-phosphopantetheinyl transferase